jgi:hypothetical protein
MRRVWLPAVLALLSGSLYFVANRGNGKVFDYTLRVAGAMLSGRLGLVETPPSWLNEFIPYEDRYYSAFPLGSVLTMLPLAVLARLGWLRDYPSPTLSGLIGVAVTLLSYMLASRGAANATRRSLYALLPALGTWLWTNTAYGGAWQIALGLAVVGQLAALVFIERSFHPLLAGACFALAFGHRGELVLLAPVFGWLAFRRAPEGRAVASLARFFAVPAALLVLTLAYNQARFGSPLDFGYARIPGVLNESWYKDGLFAVSAIPRNAYHMLLEPWRRLPSFPWLVPSGWGGSILLSCPMLLLLFRRGGERLVVVTAWVAMALATAVLWLHGNPGGWQYSYRYASDLVPWMVLLWTAHGGPGVSGLERILFVASLAVNAWATYLFQWTTYVRP